MSKLNINHTFAGTRTGREAQKSKDPRTHVSNYLCYLDNLELGGGLAVEDVEQLGFDPLFHDLLEGIHQLLR
jgi:hypothetical protein